MTSMTTPIVVSTPDTEAYKYSEETFTAKSKTFNSSTLFWSVNMVTSKRLIDAALRSTISSKQNENTSFVTNV